MSDFGYIRVSSREQNEDRQLLAISEVGVGKKNIYLDKQSGKDFNRPMYIIFYGDIVVPKVAPEYYDTPEFTLIDSLNKIGADSSFKHRAKIAKANNIQNYIGSVEQNLLMLQLLNEGKLIVA